MSLEVKEAKEFVPVVLESRSFRLIQVYKDWLSPALEGQGQDFTLEIKFFYPFRSRNRTRFKVTLDSIDPSYYDILSTLSGKSKIDFRKEVLLNIENLIGEDKKYIRGRGRVLDSTGGDYEAS